MKTLKNYYANSLNRLFIKYLLDRNELDKEIGSNRFLFFKKGNFIESSKYLFSD